MKLNISLILTYAITFIRAQKEGINLWERRIMDTLPKVVAKGPDNIQGCQFVDKALEVIGVNPTKTLP